MMDWLRQPVGKLLHHLLFHRQEEEYKQSLNRLMSLQDSAVERERIAEVKEKKYNALIKAAEDERNKKLTLEDLQLTPNEKVILKSCDKAFRHALFKSGEHMCLTAFPECCRQTAWQMREYQRDLTHTEKNHVPDIDDTIQTKAEEKSKKYFTPKL